MNNTPRKSLLAPALSERTSTASPLDTQAVRAAEQMDLLKDMARVNMAMAEEVSRQAMQATDPAVIADLVGQFEELAVSICETIALEAELARAERTRKARLLAAAAPVCDAVQATLTARDVASALRQLRREGGRLSYLDSVREDPAVGAVRRRRRLDLGGLDDDSTPWIIKPTTRRSGSA